MKIIQNNRNRFAIDRARAVMLNIDPHEQRSLDAILDAIRTADQRDADDAAQIVWVRWFHYERALAPHGRCPRCGGPLDFEPASIDEVPHHGALVALEYRDAHGCPECGVEIPADQIVRVA